jgi:hypothetical protein
MKSQRVDLQPEHAHELLAALDEAPAAAPLVAKVAVRGVGDDAVG